MYFIRFSQANHRHIIHNEIQIHDSHRCSQRSRLPSSFTLLSKVRHHELASPHQNRLELDTKTRQKQYQSFTYQTYYRRHHYIREVHDNDEIDIEHVSAAAQAADILTKSLNAIAHACAVELLNLQPFFIPTAS